MPLPPRSGPRPRGPSRSVSAAVLTFLFSRRACGETIDARSEKIMPAIKHARTSVLDIAYEDSGPADGTPVFLMHGFPYDPRSYDEVVPLLAAHGCRTIVPYLRGYGPTRFLSGDTMRSGEQAALGNDLKKLMDALAIDRAFLCGYDWGGRACCIVAALWPERVRGLVSGGGYNMHDVAGSIRPAAGCAAADSGAHDRAARRGGRHFAAAVFREPRAPFCRPVPAPHDCAHRSRGPAGRAARDRGGRAGTGPRLSALRHYIRVTCQ